eukprot:c11457_g1_i2.p1 GENE.c11457_g1_i2~~c11457_g1_i2.p1  ORF type:complete len:502 (+),score=112.39 c11457_g1_i2:175-1506(+)
MSQRMTRLVHLANACAAVRHSESEYRQRNLSSTSNGRPTNAESFGIEVATRPGVVSGPAAAMTQAQEDQFLKSLNKKHGFRRIERFEELVQLFRNDDGLDDSPALAPHSLALALSHQVCGFCTEESVRGLRYEICTFVRSEILSNRNYKAAIMRWASTPVTNYLNGMSHSEPFDEAMVDAFCKLRRVVVVVWTVSGPVVFGEDSRAKAKQIVYNVARVDRTDLGDPYTAFHSLSSKYEPRRVLNFPGPAFLSEPRETPTRLFIVFDPCVLFGFSDAVARHLKPATKADLVDRVKKQIWPWAKTHFTGFGALLCFPLAVERDISERLQRPLSEKNSALIAQDVFDQLRSHEFVRIQSASEEGKVAQRCFNPKTSSIVAWAKEMKSPESRVILVSNKPLVTGDEDIVGVSRKQWGEYLTRLERLESGDDEEAVLWEILGDVIDQQ